MKIDEIADLLGDEAGYLLDFDAPRVPKDTLQLPGAEWVDRVCCDSDRPTPVLRSLQSLFSNGSLGGTGYLSILPVDQGIEHSAGASFAPNPIYFDPENIVKLAVEAGCNAVASTLGALGSVARKYAHIIPFIVKINHNELLTCPNHYDQILFASVEQAFDMGAVAVGATIYFGSEESDRQIMEISEAFEAAHNLGMACILWCYVRNEAFIVDGANYEASADITGQANYLGATIGADIIKQKSPIINGGYEAVNKAGVKFGKYDRRMYDELCSDHPIDMTRYQLLNCYMGRVGLINSGGGSGKNDMAEAVRTAVINKRAGGMGLISGRKTFQKPLDEGIRLFEAIQNVYLCDEVTVA
ncbi:MAG: fructose-bisphosphate aldolase [Candidatus Anoxymicrobium japonicum]|uniref:fructose-bisphosphate aldolase n=1 Tax=Candidatus Anoxymicrobium japonicum TaxID=2013648 RepID=A0A2N3G7U0_9ACTN|nr:MAG: fructose-bisphosphate aldolase [Candidatus Anoxymicrobium japonicum]